jgi:hypothetical protein
MRRDEEARYLEWLYLNTWFCTNCGARHTFTTNVCPKLISAQRNISANAETAPVAENR